MKILSFTIVITDFSSSNNKVILVRVIVKYLNIGVTIDYMTSKYPKTFYITVKWVYSVPLITIILSITYLQQVNEDYQ